MKFGLSTKTIQLIQTAFKPYYHVEQVLIYGSRALGNYKLGSDIDLTLIGNNITEDDLSHIMRDLDELPIPYTCDVSVFSNLNNLNLIDHIRRVGKIFYSLPP